MSNVVCSVVVGFIPALQGGAFSSNFRNALAFDVSVGDTLTVTTPEIDSLTVEVYNTPDTPPTELYQTAELLCETDDYDGTIGLYSHLQRMTDMRMEYDVYAVRIPDNRESDSLGEIRELRIN